MGIFKNTLGGVLKMGYAFLWQESVIDLMSHLPDSPFIKKFANEAGSQLIPLINQLFNSVTSFDHKNIYFQSAKNFYPGQIACSQESHTHAKWHVQSGIALLDFAMFADEFHRILHLHNDTNE